MRRSTGRFYAFCAIVFALGFAASGYLNYIQYQREQEHQQANRDTVAELKREIGLSGGATPTPTSAASILGAHMLKIPQLGVSVSTLNPLSDLSYQYQQENGLDQVNLTSTSLIKTTTTCGPGALGKLIKQPSDAKPQLAQSGFIKLVGNFNYYYIASKTACAKDPVSTAALKADNAVLPAVLATLATL